MTPTVIVSLVFALISLTAWLVRLEFKANSTEKSREKDVADLKAEQKELELDIKDTRTRFFEHAANVNFHHNEAAQAEFKTALERRIMGMEGSLKDINVKLDRMSTK
jgi:hypothetical protein